MSLGTLRYFLAGFSVGVVRKAVLTQLQDTNVSRYDQEYTHIITRPTLMTERAAICLGAGVLYATCLPIYLYTDLCRLEVYATGGKQSEFNREPRKIEGILDHILEF